MEIILHQKYLTKRLRAPAISRLQKVHNVEISISALQDAGEMSFALNVNKSI